MTDVRAHLLLADGDPSFRRLLRDYLEVHGFAVAEAADGAQMRSSLESAPPDAVLLDEQLPGEDGLALGRLLRERYDLGLILLTAAGDVVERVVGLELGADDCIAKPFDFRELLARVKSLLRRLRGRPSPTEPPAPHDEVEPLRLRRRFGRCEVDLEAHRMFDADGAEVNLTSMEYALLATFLANPNRVLTRDQLLLRTRNREWEPFDRSIDIRVGRLRRKVEPPPPGPRCIRTVRNAGYMFVPP